MKRSRSPRDLWASLLPLVVGPLALAVAMRFPAMVRTEPMPVWLLVTLGVAGVAAACHRPAVGMATLGLGTLILPAAFRLSGAMPEAALAAAVLLSAELLLHVVHRLANFQPTERRGFLPRSLESTGRVALVALASGGMWTLGTARAWNPTAALFAAAAVYFLAWIGLEVADRKLRRPESPLLWRRILVPLSVDAGGWIAGAAVLSVGERAGWPLAAFLAGCLAALGVEITRNGLLHRKAQDRVRDLDRLRRASKRMTTPLEEMASTADRIYTECVKVLKKTQFFWFQFEALAPGSEFKSWWWRAGLRDPRGGGAGAAPLSAGPAGVPSPQPVAARRARPAGQAGQHRARPPPPLVRSPPRRSPRGSSCSRISCRRWPFRCAALPARPRGERGPADRRRHAPRPRAPPATRGTPAAARPGGR